MPEAIRASRAAADRLNQGCQCVSLDQARLQVALAGELGARFKLETAHPHIAAPTPVFLPQADGLAMQTIAAAIEAAAAREPYRSLALAHAPAIAQHAFGPRGALMGYDFHLAADGPKLIEINTNAGGAFLNALLAKAHLACCDEIERALARSGLETFEAEIIAMFKAEWRLQRGDRRLHRIAIVDDAPADQFLHPEFELARNLLQRAGYAAEIVDARELDFDGERLAAGGFDIDLVYNRLVDFDLAAPEHAALRAAYAAGAVVVTPNPHNHALLADKRNLARLADPALALLPPNAAAAVPHAVMVTPENADALWAQRKHFYFKPTSGHGGKAVYRGDKLTRGAWNSILAGDYIAQAAVAPSTRLVRLGAETLQRKLDVRLYTYAGRTLLTAARLYQGQTTNFRTPGGGFAPIFFV